MALKSYHRETLNGNWYEERAKPLNGVLPFDAVNDFQTSTATDFNGSQPISFRHKPRMINESNINEAIRLAASSNPSRTFGSLYPVPNEDLERNLISTQHRVHTNHFTSPILPGNAVERGNATPRAISEVFRTSSEPQKDTRAQRSWMYSIDPMITAINRRELTESRAIKKREPLDNHIKNYGRQTTAITSIRSRHTGVFVDDEPGCQQ
ncbi:uncharacterized protein PHALS_04244 [Plasmopara halstedii]|uniref:Uncharacterized protein n=1 Tax=Plasmopara halstedii TaxID=4781 RepID=A0A0P1AY38_PLAHL|nr:uncharacterized protein PHALS_04244 [Plasmopara halstedii]CEG47361.1 hypothetical protein PHALS_04244 [Plasmopara halstedii]|eukprot:XP_024583730.1 hypothetical protein PHALS_04244 [Plasmopara halstedii]